MGDGELEAVGVSLLGIFVDDGSTGIRQSEDLGRLVEGLARGVVDGAAEALHVEIVVDLQQQSMATGDGQAEEREGGHRFLCLRLLQKIGQHMGLQMVHLHQGDVQAIGHGLGERATYKQGSEQSGAICESDGR